MPTPTSKHPVFISYARAASRSPAVALYEALGGEHGRLCFLDSTDIEAGEPFPSTLVDSLLDARVVVIFVEPIYFTRDFCRLELEVASTPFLRLVASGAPQDERDAALGGIVLALPSSGTDPMLDRVPPALRDLSWPSAENPHELAAVVRRRLDDSPSTFRKRYEESGELKAVRAMLLEGCRLLPPLAIRGIPFVAPPTMRESLRSRFLGRADDLWRVHEALTTRRGDLKAAAGVVCSLEAAGGFGKTQIAAEYVYRHATRTFSGGIFWIDAEGDPELQLYEVLRSLDSNTPAIEALRPPHGSGVAAALARTIRARLAPADPILFVIDNVPEPEREKSPIPLQNWCPVLGEVSVLSTSRRSIRMDSAVVTRLEIRELQPEHAAMLLRWDLPPASLTQAEWESIAEWVGHLPLALELLNALLHFGGMPPQDLLARSRGGAPIAGLDTALAVLRPHVPRGALRGISEVLSISYERLTAEQQSAARLLAWMAPAAIPEVVAHAFGPALAPSTRAILRSRHWVTQILGSLDDGMTYFGVMHRVVADFLRSRSAEPRAEAQQVSAVLADLMVKAGQDGDRGRARMRTCAPPLLAHVALRLAREKKNTIRLGALQYANSAGIQLWQAGLPGHAADILEPLRKTAVTLLGPDHPDTLSITTNLANARHDLGDFSVANSLFVQIVQGRQRTLGATHRETLLALSNQASNLRDMGQAGNARALHERVLKVHRRILGESHCVTLSTMINLALTLCDQGDFMGARDLYEHVVEAAPRVCGEDHPTTLLARNNLAATLRQLGDTAGARILNERVLERRQRALGQQHPATLMSLNNAALSLRDRGDLSGAQQLYEQILDSRRQAFGAEHPDTLDSMHNLANVLYERGKLTTAQELREQVVEAMTRVYGPEHPHTLSAASSLANTLRDRRHFVRAESLYVKQLELQRRLLGDRHPDTLLTMFNLAVLLSLTYDFSTAETIHGQVFDVRRQVLGEEHLVTLSSMHNLAITRRVREDLNGARQLQGPLMRMMRKNRGPDHPDTLNSMQELAITMSLQGEVREALALMKDVIDAKKRLLGEEHPETVLMMALRVLMRIRGMVPGYSTIAPPFRRVRLWLRAFKYRGMRSERVRLTLLRTVDVSTKSDPR